MHDMHDMHDMDRSCMQYICSPASFTANRLQKSSSPDIRQVGPRSPAAVLLREARAGQKRHQAEVDEFEFSSFALCKGVGKEGRSINQGSFCVYKGSLQPHTPFLTTLINQLDIDSISESVKRDPDLVHRG